MCAQAQYTNIHLSYTENTIPKQAIETGLPKNFICFLTLTVDHKQLYIKIYWCNDCPTTNLRSEGLGRRRFFPEK